MNNKKELKYKESAIELLEICKKCWKKYPEEHSYITNVCDSVIRWYSHQIPAKYASKAALKLAKTKQVDLSQQSFKTQGIFDKGHKTFHFEHCNALKTIKEQFYDGKIDVEKLIELSQEVAWITKLENQELTARGYKTERNGGWEKCYNDCKIEIKEL